MRKLSHAEIVARQEKQLPEKRLPFTIILNNIRSLYNVGSIFRTADGVGVEKIWLCGITGHPPHQQITKTALSAENHVPWEYSQDIRRVLKHLRERHYQIVLLEQTNESRPYNEFKPCVPVSLIIGNEIEGASETILSFCDEAIDIEMAGLKNSLNVAVAFGIVAYDIRYKLITAAR